MFILGFSGYIGCLEEVELQQPCSDTEVLHCPSRTRNNTVQIGCWQGFGFFLAILLGSYSNHPPTCYSTLILSSPLALGRRERRLEGKGMKTSLGYVQYVWAIPVSIVRISTNPSIGNQQSSKCKSKCSIRNQQQGSSSCHKPFGPLQNPQS